MKHNYKQFSSLVSRNKKDANTGLSESFKEGSLIDKQVADFAIYFNILTTKEGIAQNGGFQTNSAHVTHCKNFMMISSQIPEHKTTKIWIARRTYHLNMKLSQNNTFVMLRNIGKDYTVLFQDIIFSCIHLTSNFERFDNNQCSWLRQTNLFH